MLLINSTGMFQVSEFQPEHPLFVLIFLSILAGAQTTFFYRHQLNEIYHPIDMTLIEILTLLHLMERTDFFFDTRA